MSHNLFNYHFLSYYFYTYLLILYRHILGRIIMHHNGKFILQKAVRFNLAASIFGSTEP